MPREELVNLLEFEEEAKKKLPPATFALIAGGDRALFDRITLRPRMNVPTTDMDLSVNLFGEDHFTPIIVAPIADQKRFHPDAELATAKGAAAGKALMIVSSRSSVALADIAAIAKPSFWYQVYASDSAAKMQVQDAVKAGAKAIVITVGASHAANGGRTATAASINWSAVDAIKQGVSVPVIVKGITTPAEATSALQHNVQGLIASNFGGLLANKDAMVLALPNIVDAVGRKVPVHRRSFRRGTDIQARHWAPGRAVGPAGDVGARGLWRSGRTECRRGAQTSWPVYGHVRQGDLKALIRTAVKCTPDTTKATIISTIERASNISFAAPKRRGHGCLIAGSHSSMRSSIRVFPAAQTDPGLNDFESSTSTRHVRQHSATGTTTPRTGMVSEPPPHRRRSTGGSRSGNAVIRPRSISRRTVDLNLKYPVVMPRQPPVALHPESSPHVSRASLSSIPDVSQHTRVSPSGGGERRAGTLVHFSAPGHGAARNARPRAGRAHRDRLTVVSRVVLRADSTTAI